MYPLSEGLYAPRNQWYVAAWSSEIGDQPIERWLLNEPVALYRKSDGAVVALEGRCPHRHFPLGKSFVVDDNVHCGYHGISFRPDGSCHNIPTQDVIPAVCRVKSYPIVEQWQWIWIWMGDPALADPSMIPDHDEVNINNPSFKVEHGTYHPVPGCYMLMHDNLMDLSHIAALHRTTIASDGVPDAVEQTWADDTCLSSERELKAVDCPPYFSALFGYAGKVNRKLLMRSYLPCLHVGEDKFVKTDEAGSEGGDELGTVYVYHAVTPATHDTAHYFFAMGRNFAVEDAAFGASMMQAIEATLDEDMFATREVHQMLDRLGYAPRELLIRSDAHCVKGRRLMEKMIRSELRDPEPSEILSAAE